MYIKKLDWFGPCLTQVSSKDQWNNVSIEGSVTELCKQLSSHIEDTNQ